MIFFQLIFSIMSLERRSERWTIATLPLIDAHPLYRMHDTIESIKVASSRRIQSARIPFENQIDTYYNFFTRSTGYKVRTVILVHSVVNKTTIYFYERDGREKFADTL